MDFRDAVFSAIHRAMRRDSRVVVATNDMGAMGLDAIRAEFPIRVINVGIAEQNLMSVAGGLAMAGKVVFAYGIVSHITARCLEQIKLDICAMNLPVALVGVGAGLAYGNDGPTHHGTEDVAFLRALPGIRIFNPCDWVSTDKAVEMIAADPGPAYIRLDKEKPDPVYDAARDDFSAGIKVLSPSAPLTVFATGISTHRALAAIRMLEQDGLRVGLADVFRLKPVNEQALLDLIKSARIIVTVEEHSVVGGLAGIIADIIARNGLPVRLRPVGLPDQYLLGSASRPWAEQEFGLTPQALSKTLRDLAKA